MAISTIPYLSPILTVDALFLGCGLHIAAFFKDLQVQALSLADPCRHQTMNTFCQDLFLRKIRLFVEQHNQVIDLVQGMQEIFGGVFIVQYVGAMFIMCTQAYLSTLVRLIGDRAIEVTALQLIGSSSSLELGERVCVAQHPLHVHHNSGTVHLHLRGITDHGRE